MKRLFFYFLIFTFTYISSFAQSPAATEYIESYRDIAIREMKRMGVPASITLAQGMLESENGNSDLVKKSNNHFGIKCKSSWTSGSVSHDDDAPGECFRIYKDADASYRDHSNYLRGSERYASLFKLDARDYKGWAYGLRKAGYATNPRYPEILIKNIEDNNLQQYTLAAIGSVPFYDASKYTSDPEEKAFLQITKNAAPDMVSEDRKVNINNLKAIFAHQGRSLLAIATDNNINLTKLLEYNDLAEDGLLPKDQNIFLEKKGKEGNKEFYEIQKGETLYDVSQTNGIRLQNLCEYNNLKPGQPMVKGQMIKLKQAVSGIAEVSIHNHQAENKIHISEHEIKADNIEPEKKTHIVEPKESLYGISRNYGISVAELKEWNNMSSDNLKIGQTLIISK